MRLVVQSTLRMTAAVRRRRVRGAVEIDGTSADGAVVAVIDRRSMLTVCAQRGVGGVYSLQVPAEYEGLRNLLVVATSPDPAYNAARADRVMPETVIE